MSLHNPRHVLVVGRVTQGDAALAVDRVWQRVDRAVRRAVRRLSADEEDRMDLLQEAMIRLWELDASRLDVRNRADMYYARRMLINRMWDVVVAEWLRLGFTEAVVRAAGYPRMPSVMREVPKDALTQFEVTLPAVQQV